MYNVPENWKDELKEYLEKQEPEKEFLTGGFRNQVGGVVIIGCPWYECFNECFSIGDPSLKEPSAFVQRIDDTGKGGRITAKEALAVLGYFL